MEWGEGEMLRFSHKSASDCAIEVAVRGCGNGCPVGCSAVDLGDRVAGEVDRVRLRVAVPLCLGCGVNDWVHTEEPGTQVKAVPHPGRDGGGGGFAVHPSTYM